MKKFEGILFATDLDGTLLCDDKSISEENKRAIEYFIAEGGMFTFITGRIPTATESILNKVKTNIPIGCSNGGAVYDYMNKKILWSVALDKSVMEMIEFVDENLPSMGIEVLSHENIYFYKKSRATEKHRIDEKLPDLAYSDMKSDEKIAKILFAGEENEIAELAKMLKTHPRAEEFEFVRSDPNYYEILPKGISKADALKKLAQLCGAKKTIAAGDNENDAKMLKEATVSFAVANASPEAKAAARYMTVSNEEDAIARIIEEIGRK